MSKLAELIRELEPFEAKPQGSLRINVDEIKAILAALRRVEKLEAALKCIRDAKAFGADVDALDDLIRDNRQTARQALTGEA